MTNDELVKRLRSGLDNVDGGELGGLVARMEEAADAVTRLQADLKEALDALRDALEQNEALRSSLSHARAEGRRKGLEEAAKVIEDMFDEDGFPVPRSAKIAAAIRAKIEETKL